MQGLITESELNQADEVFPGIAAFFAALTVKPGTFLELVSVFDNWCAACAVVACGSSSTIPVTTDADAPVQADATATATAAT